MNILVGTSGFSYQGWRGDFYPQDVSPNNMIGYYAKRLSAVEINNTSLRPPKEQSLDKWAQQVPYTFRFSVKAPQAITHRNGRQGVENEISHFLHDVETLEHLLGVILFQVPVFVHKEFSLLDAIFDYWPRDLPVALEFHHPSWHDNDVYRFLQRNNIALCNSDNDEQDDAIISTANWGYLRMRKGDYDTMTMENCLRDIQMQPWEQVYVFFRHQENSQSPISANRFLQLVNDKH
jgi:uncharacterized protein YecE (DUF72 family)